MTTGDKWKIAMLTIFTLGFCWLYWRIKNNKVKKLKKGEINRLDSSMDTLELVNLLGGKNNIISASSTISRIKVFINDKTAVQKDKLEQLKYVSGLMISSNNISIVVGDYAKKLCEELNNEIMK
ncbi:PTS transporter subunit EIIB [Mycoplasmopsis agalactiae]|uniref:PTS transporter subunit EIIB n=1 Tax=Mycoplasmopsis agalactiae TaxID=2110 RepID=UPI001F95F8B7|nr:PTS transporter subunit EIIB [Mycoplasmopsis agalactiae]MCE6061604.1 PTS transporter subunit EIIB [Mycoplasmopsis agalactiae]